jgi:hypothetical protein
MRKRRLAGEVAKVSKEKEAGLRRIPLQPAFSL